MLYANLLFGFVLLVVGGDTLVRGAVNVARRLGVSPLMIGLTLVGFGTSCPELITSLKAAHTGSPGIAIGNVVGSNIANILLILGIAAVIFPVYCERKAFCRDGSVLAVATALALLVFARGEISRFAGIILFCSLLSYIAYVYLKESSSSNELVGNALVTTQGVASKWRTSLIVSLLLFVLGLGLTVLGADLLVKGAVALALEIGLSDTVVGLTVVAIGTSLPELVTTVMASVRKNSDVAFGNIVGSNIYNILGILGLTAAVHPIAVPSQVIARDMWIMGLATVILIFFAVTGWRISRREGVFLLFLYVVYSFLLLS